MDVLEAIHTRRTIFKFKPGGVPKDVIEKIFEAGLWAPNHHLTEPWRFVPGRRHQRNTGATLQRNSRGKSR